MENDTSFIAEESVARLRATVGELEQLIHIETDQTTLVELQQLKDRISSVLQQLEEGHL